MSRSSGFLGFVYFCVFEMLGFVVLVNISLDCSLMSLFLAPLFFLAYVYILFLLGFDI